MSLDGAHQPSKTDMDVKSLFSKTKKKIKPVTVQVLPPPPPPPPPKIDVFGVAGRDEGWEREFGKLDQYLNERGLRIERVADDGSCLFASIAIHFPGSTPSDLRTSAVKFMLTHPDDFEPFIDTEAYPNGFKDYCSRMLMTTTWGSQLELQAISQAKEVNIVIFQTGDKSRIDMVNFDDNDARCVTISYHDGQHYNCVLSNREGSEADSQISFRSLKNQLDINKLNEGTENVPQVSASSNKMKSKKKSLFS